MASDEGTPSRSAVHRLYAAFREGDGEAMQACYAPDATFRDEVFDLRGAEEVGAMWKMLLARGSDLEVGVRDIHVDGDEATAHWVADYTFGATGRQVHNEIEASLRLRDGLIAEHLDRFSFWGWSRQALGPVGLALGWSPLLRGKVRTQARRGLDAWQREHA